jgi:hypothetical protein
MDASPVGDDGLESLANPSRIRRVSPIRGAESGAIGGPLVATDERLLEVMELWLLLSEPIKCAILAMIRSTEAID